MINVKDCIGKKVILKGRQYRRESYYETDILQLSPNKQYVKVRIFDDKEEWKSISDFGKGFWKYEIVDILGDVDKF